MSAAQIKRTLHATLLPMLLLAIVFAGSVRAAENWQSVPPNPDIDFVYGPASPKYEAIRQKLMDRKILEELQRFFSFLHLPHHLQLRTEQCGEVNAFYSSDRSITLCYELIAPIIARAPETVSANGFVTRDAAIFGSIAGILLHESGHMMFDMFDVPRFGREEDAADEMSAFLALQVNQDIARTVIEGFAYFNQIIAGDPNPRSPMRAWSDVHGTGSQRLYNTLCLAYGAYPNSFQPFVDRGWLPKTRAAGCAAEYDLVKQAFDETIMPFTDSSLLLRVEGAQWLTPQELK